jgi:predicted MPP superfamily phosphohydrolase
LIVQNFVAQNSKNRPSLMGSQDVHWHKRTGAAIIIEQKVSLLLLCSAWQAENAASRICALSSPMRHIHLYMPFPAKLGWEEGRQAAHGGWEVSPLDAQQSSAELRCPDMALALSLFALFALLLLFTGAFATGLRFPVYTILTEKAKEPFRILAIADLHDRPINSKGAALAERVRAQKPDAVCLCGDVFDERRAHDGTFAFLSELQEICPALFVTGNHEYKTKEADKIKRKLSAMGIHVLSGPGSTVEMMGGQLKIYGVDDPRSGKFFSQLREIGKNASQSDFNVLLSHRPEYFEIYAAYGFDLVLSGHAHGGQWRIPKILNGLYSPGQGIFPKYAGGFFKEGRTAMAVSRGLSDLPRWVPRFYNPPEIVVVNITPREKKAENKEAAEPGKGMKDAQAAQKSIGDDSPSPDKSDASFSE